jgi:hypothetical protein
MDRATPTDSGLRRVLRMAAMVVATTYPTAVGATVLVVLPDTPKAARLVVPLRGVRVGPRARDLLPAIDREVRESYPEAKAVMLYIRLESGKPAWLPVS